MDPEQTMCDPANRPLRLQVRREGRRFLQGGAAPSRRSGGLPSAAAHPHPGLCCAGLPVIQRGRYVCMANNRDSSTLVLKSGIPLELTWGVI